METGAHRRPKWVWGATDRLGEPETSGRDWRWLRSCWRQAEEELGSHAAEGRRDPRPHPPLPACTSGLQELAGITSWTCLSCPGPCSQ